MQFRPSSRDKWRLAAPLMPQGLGWQEHFLIDGRAPAPGQLFRSPAMAATLEAIAATHGEAFYRGELADAMVRHSNANGGAHARNDFERHTLDWVTPIGIDYRGVTVHEIPPNGQGIAALMALGMLTAFDIGALPPDSVASQHLQIEAMKLAFADAHRYVSDPSTMTVTPQALLDAGYLRERARLIDPTRAQIFGPGAPPRGGTVYICAADASGMIVSLIQSNYMGFGSGVVVPGHRHQPAESRRRIFARARPSERSRRRQAAVPHDHSGLHHARRRAARRVRRDGRPDPAAGPRADGRAAWSTTR